MTRKAALLLIALAGCFEDGGEAVEASGKETPATGAPAAAGSGPATPTSAPTGMVTVSGPLAPPRVAEPLRVLVGGDLLPHRPSLVTPTAISDALAPLAPLFATADAVVANYEAATGEVDRRTSRMVYAAPPEWLAALPAAGIAAVTVANNHACDLGEAGLSATLAAARDGSVLALGADDDGDPWAPRVVVERDGRRVCAVAWTTLVNGRTACARSSRLAVAHPSAASKTRIEHAVARARAQCDATIAILHGGDEYEAQTTLVMDQAARAAEAGADAVVVHHPHVPSPIVVHSTRDGRSVPIFASVGNLVTNQGESWKPPMFPVMRDNRRLVCVNGWTRLGLLAELRFRFAQSTTTLDWRSHLVWIDNEHAEDHTIAVPHIAARLLDPEKDRALVSRLSDDTRGPVALFDEPCWSERAMDPPRERCTLVRRDGAPPRPSTRAASRRKD